MVVPYRWWGGVEATRGEGTGTRPIIIFFVQPLVKFRLDHPSSIIIYSMRNRMHAGSSGASSEDGGNQEATRRCLDRRHFELCDSQTRPSSEHALQKKTIDWMHA